MSELPERLTAIRVALAAARGATVQSPAFLYLYDTVHRMSDSSHDQTIEFLIHQIKHTLDGALDNSCAFTDHDLHRFSDTLSEIEDDLVLRGKGSRVSSDSSRSQESLGQRALYALEMKSEATRQLVSRLAYYGVPVQSIDKTVNIEMHCDQSGSAVIVVESAVLLNNPSLSARLSLLRRKFRDSLRIVVVSEADNFGARLAGVRAGGDLFFSLPVELSSFMSRLDAMTTRAEVDPYHVLVVDDSPEEVAEIALILQRAGMITSVVTEPSQVFQVLVETKPDLIVMSVDLVGCDGAELATVIRQQEAFVAVPILFLSTREDPERIIESIRTAGDEVIRKPVDGGHLVGAVGIRIERSRQMRFFMERDSLTGLLNHTNLTESLATEVQRAQRIGTNLGFAMIDLDNFKHVNDTYGHLMGDRVLRSLAWLFQDQLRRTDIVGRYGGEEFGIIFFNTGLSETVAITNRIRESFASIRHQVGDQEFSVTFSCGIAGFPEHQGTLELTAEADRALYLAKQAGRNRIVTA